MSLSRFYVYYYQLLIPLAQNNLHLLAADGGCTERKVSRSSRKKRRSEKSTRSIFFSAQTLVSFANSSKTSGAIKYLAIDHTKKWRI